ncbi:hypothetical protein AKJ09_08089 [Labilithrix luteola]|uniref:Uncharacterized protein n=1 Tax=Labilithrix luteola TaxID=1391654 RepID=A0A0K1Q6G2_9BACT|nr:hypothetical protein AKJ09_08089 [Labilithrix luteola]
MDEAQTIVASAAPVASAPEKNGRFIRSYLPARDSRFDERVGGYGPHVKWTCAFCDFRASA